MSEATLEAAKLQMAITTTEYPHRTTCLVRRVTDTHFEAQFRYEAENEWVLLPLSEVAAARVLRQVQKIPKGVYSLVQIDLLDAHPEIEIEALRAQVRFMRDHPRGSCACGGRPAGAATSPEEVPSAEFRMDPFTCHENCHYSSGCGYWDCMWYCMVKA